MVVITPYMFGLLIERHRDFIVDSFIGNARRLVPAAHNKSPSFLEDQLQDVIKALVDFLKREGDPVVTENSARFARLHGQQRASSADYSLHNIQIESEIVRELIMGLLRPDQVLANQTASLYARCCEMTLSETTAPFVRTRLQAEAGVSP